MIILQLNRLSGLLAILLFVGCFPACGSPRVDPAYTRLVEAAQDVPDSGELGVDDVFEIRVHQHKDLSGEFTVTDEGTVNFPFVGEVAVRGMTCPEVERAIAAKLQDGYLQNPSVLCGITEQNSRRIYVFGEIKKPGTLPYKSEMTIVEAVALAGGFTERANSNGTKLSRKIQGTEIQVQVPMQEIVEGKSQNIKMLPGDIVYVPERLY
jgi:protein involved in polysaccharide export with SLBB domain